MYEPIVVVDAAGERRTSLAAEPQLDLTQLFAHAACHVRAVSLPVT